MAANRLFLPFLLIMTIGFFVRAQEPATSHGVSVQHPIDDTFDITPWVQKFVSETKRPFHAYHWAEREKVGSDSLGFGINPTGPIDPSDERVTNHVKDWSEYFFKSVGHGLYLGTDPVNYRSFGGEHFLLYRLKIPKGLRVMDFEKGYDRSGENRMSSEQVELLKSHGCDPGDASLDWEDMFRGEGYHNETHPKCIAMVYAALQKLGIDLIRYRKGSTDFRDCPGPRTRAAYILLNPKAIPKEGVAYFYKEMKDPALREEQVQIEKLFLETTGPGYLVSSEPLKTRPWPELDSEAKEAPSQFISEQLLDCAK